MRTTIDLAEIGVIERELENGWLKIILMGGWEAPEWSIILETAVPDRLDEVYVPSYAESWGKDTIRKLEKLRAVITDVLDYVFQIEKERRQNAAE